MNEGSYLEAAWQKDQL